MKPKTTSNNVRAADHFHAIIRGRQQIPEASVTSKGGSVDPLLHTERLSTENSRLLPPLRIVTLPEETE